MRAEEKSRARDVGLSTAVSGGDGDNGHAHKRRNEENGGRTERTSGARCEQPLSAANHPALSVSSSFTPFLRFDPVSSVFLRLLELRLLELRLL
jgi:hypothetical protein